MQGGAIPISQSREVVETEISIIFREGESKRMADKEQSSQPMVGGEGPQSYAQNSSIQKKVVEHTKELIREAVTEKLDLLKIIDSNTIRVADLGCSVGPNTFIAMQNIIEAIEFKFYKTYQSNKIIKLEFQLFCNDLSDNDFNTLFKLLPPSRNYFTNAVPGSFHGRLFPKSSLHFVHSSSSLHWLSKVPQQVVDNKSPAWNRGHIISTGLVKEVAEAYSNQFMNDIEAFLTARAQEIIDGGLMVLILPGLPDGVPMSQSRMGMTFELLLSCLNDLFILGLVEQEKFDSFNIPFYYSNANEMVRIIERNGYFIIEKIQELRKDVSVRPDMMPLITSHLRAAFGGVIKEHFGQEMVDELFNYFPKKLANSKLMLTDENCNDVDLFILLKRKS